MLVTSGEGGWEESLVGKGGQTVVMEGHQTLGGELIIEHLYVTF